MAEGKTGKMNFREETNDTKQDHKIMDTFKGYLDNISAAATNHGNAYLLLTNNMSDIFSNNTTLTSTVVMTQKENCTLRNKINSLGNELAAATGKKSPTTTKTYTIPWPGTCNPKKWLKGGYYWAHGYVVVPDHRSSTCGSRSNNTQNKEKSTR